MTKGRTHKGMSSAPFYAHLFPTRSFRKTHQLSNQTCHQKGHNIYRYDSRSNWGSAQDGNDNPKKGTHN